MKMFALARVQDVPQAVRMFADDGKRLYSGHVLCGQVGTWGAYLFSGTAAQLLAINALPNVYGICAVTESGNVRWAELDGVIPAAVRTKINDWLSTRSLPTIPAGWTYRQVVMAIYRRMNERFDLATHDVMDA